MIISSLPQQFLWWYFLCPGPQTRLQPKIQLIVVSLSSQIKVKPPDYPASSSSASASRTSSRTPRSRCWSSPRSRLGTSHSMTRIEAARTLSPASAPQFSPATVNNIGVGKVSERGGNLVNFEYPVHQTIVFLRDTFPIHDFIWIITTEGKTFSDAKK